MEPYSLLHCVFYCNAIEPFGWEFMTNPMASIVLLCWEMVPSCVSLTHVSSINWWKHEKILACEMYYDYMFMVIVGMLIVWLPVDAI